MIPECKKLRADDRKRAKIPVKENRRDRRKELRVHAGNVLRQLRDVVSALNDVRRDRRRRDTYGRSAILRSDRCGQLENALGVLIGERADIVPIGKRWIRVRVASTARHIES